MARCFRSEVTERQIMGVPTVLLNGEHFGQGRMTLEEIVGKIDTGAVQREAEKVSARAPFDVLIVGGGPAGAAAAIYAARKGIRTGVVSERFGGQVLDTLAIENFISVKETDGPKTRRRPRGARARIRRRHHEPAARRGAAAGRRWRP
jgi:alkyl hydroperoxide reductase subunit F